MKKYVFVFILLMLVAFPVYAVEGNDIKIKENTNEEEVVSALNKIDVVLEKCVDGDTAKFKTSDGSITTYRFLAVDTPEVSHPTKGVEPYGKEASEFVCETLTNATKIVLELDENADLVDEYNRGLAWVFVDDELLQEKLVSRGFAEVAYLYDNYKYSNLLKEKEKEAKNKKTSR